MFTTIIKHTTVALLLITLLIPVSAAQAASPTAAQLASWIQQLTLAQAQLDTLLAKRVAGASTVSVTNDTELLNAIVNARGGETILLQPGFYGDIVIIGGQYNQTRVGSLRRGAGTPNLISPVNIQSADRNNRAVVNAIQVRASNNWEFRDLSIFPDTKRLAVELSGTNNVKLIGNNVSFGDTTNWSQNDWLAKAGNAISVRDGSDNEVAYNYIQNVYHAIAVDSDRAYVHHNYITDFAADGLRAIGDNGRYEHNYVTNPLQIDANHSDAFQSWSVGADNRAGTGVNVGNQVRFNSFIHQNRPHPLRASNQGIGMFDGMFENWVIENNLIVANHWHGISVYGAINTVVRNNVVLDPNTERPGPSWIKLFNHKNGTPPTNSIVENNYANQPFSTTTGVTMSNNTAVPFAQYGQYFTNHTAGDFTLRPGAVPFTVGATIDTNQLAPAPVFRARPVTNPVATTTPVTPAPVATTTPPQPTNPPVITPPTTTTPAPTNPTPIATTTPDTDVELRFTASKKTAVVGETVTLSWTSERASTCTASNAWSGAKELQGIGVSITLERVGENRFTLSCVNDTDRTSKSVVVDVVAQAVTPPAPTKVIPPNRSTTTAATFKVGDRINVITNVNVRTTGLIDRSTLIGVNPRGSIGTVTSGPTFSDDRFGKITWYNVNFDRGFDGIVGSNNFQLISSATSTTSATTSTQAATIQAQIKALMDQIAALQKILESLR